MKNLQSNAHSHREYSYCYHTLSFWFLLSPSRECYWYIYYSSCLLLFYFMFYIQVPTASCSVKQGTVPYFEYFVYSSLSFSLQYKIVPIKTPCLLIPVVPFILRIPLSSWTHIRKLISILRSNLSKGIRISGNFSGNFPESFIKCKKCT